MTGILNGLPVKDASLLCLVALLVRSILESVDVCLSKWSSQANVELAPPYMKRFSIFSHGYRFSEKKFMQMLGFKISIHFIG